MAYYRLLIKKTIKNRVSLISMLILLFGIISLYLINVTSGETFSYQSTTKEHYNQTKELVSYYLEELNGDIDYSEEDVMMFENALQDILEQKEWNEDILESIEKQEWSSALDRSVKILNRHLEVNEQNGGELFPSEHVAVLNQEIVFYEALSQLNQAPDTDGYEKFGFNYVFRVMDSLIPILFVFILAILLTEIFLSTYKQKMNIEILLPTSFVYTTIRKLIYSVLLAIIIYITTLIFSFVIANLISGPGSLQYPVLDYSGPIPATSPIWLILVKMFVLQVLSIVSIVLVVALISFVSKNKLIALLISTVIIIGSNLAQKTMEIFHPLIHLNPFTYLASGDVVTNFMAMETNNNQITFGTGIIVLSIVSLILLVVICFIVSKREQKQLMMKS